MGAIPYMPLYVADYLADAAHLSTLEHGAYLLLIMTYWQRGKGLPSSNERLANVARLSNEDFTRVRPALEGFFQEIDGYWIHKRIERELGRFREKSDKARSAGLASAERRSSKRSTGAEQTSNHTDTDTDTKTPPTPSSGGNDCISAAQLIHSHHPKMRRDVGVNAVAKKLEAILRHQRVKRPDRLNYLRRLVEEHARRCESVDWQKDGGEYAKSLANYLAPSQGRYEPQDPSEEAVEQIETESERAARIERQYTADRHNIAQGEEEYREAFVKSRERAQAS